MYLLAGSTISNFICEAIFIYYIVTGYPVDDMPWRSLGVLSFSVRIIFNIAILTMLFKPLPAQGEALVRASNGLSAIILRRGPALFSAFAVSLAIVHSFSVLLTLDPSLRAPNWLAIKIPLALSIISGGLWLVASWIALLAPFLFRQLFACLRCRVKLLAASVILLQSILVSLMFFGLVDMNALNAMLAFSGVSLAIFNWLVFAASLTLLREQNFPGNL